ncbi:pyridoxal phosphate-dependent aminotransferase [candidate division KSB1 bacterium]
MKPLSEKLNNMQPSCTVAINSKANELKRQGIDVINLSAGQPDFNSPENVKEAGIRAIKENRTFYTTTSGIIELKEAIIKKLKKENGLDYTTDNIIVSCGAKHSIYNAIQAITNPGDEIIIPVPYWVSYPDMVDMAGGIPVFLDADKECEFKITPEQLQEKINPKTKALIFNSPSNPTGSIYTGEEIEAIAKVIVDTDIFVISDEIYEYLIYDNKEHISIASFGEKIKDLTILVNGISKSAAMTGWRIGYTAAIREIVKNMSKIQGHSTSNPTSISQYAAVEAVTTSREYANYMLPKFDERRKYMHSYLSALNGVEVCLPGGAFYVFPDISSFFGKTYRDFKIEDSFSFCDYMLEEEKIAIVPGKAFGNDNCVRISYATSLDLIKEAMERFKEGLGKLS